MSRPHASDEPQDRLTRIGDVMLLAFESHSEYQEDDKAIVLLDNGTRGGIALHGYDTSRDAIDDIYRHLRAMLQTIGKDLEVLDMGDTDASAN